MVLYKKRLDVRILSNEREKLDELVKSGKYRNYSIAVREAIEEFLIKKDKQAKFLNRS